MVFGGTAPTQVVPFAQSALSRHQTLQTPIVEVIVGSTQRASCTFAMPHPGSTAVVENAHASVRWRVAVQVGVFIS